MASKDYAHIETDKELAELESRIAQVYADAAAEMKVTVDDYFDSYAKRYEQYLNEYNAGNITKEEFQQWELNQIGRGERYEAMQDALANRFVNADEVAMAYVNDATPSIYSLNRNYSNYAINQYDPDLDFSLWDDSTVRNLIVNQPDLMPYYPESRAIQRGIDLAYGKSQITKAVTSGILQGKSLSKIARDLMNRIEGMSLNSALRAARTATTAAENAGRQDSYEEAADMGLKMEKVWLATLDSRTRVAHQQADMQVVGYDKTFNVGGESLMFPGDASHGASGWNLYNCRCTMFEKPEGMSMDDFERWARDPETGAREQVTGQSYEDWIKSKQGNTDEEEPLTEVTNRAEAKQALQSVVGFDHIEDSFDKMNEGLAVDNVNQLIKLEDKFGAIHDSQYTSFSNENSKGAIAYVQKLTSQPTNQTLSLCKSEYNKDQSSFIAMEKDSVESGWSMPCATTDQELSVYSVTHEYGHMVENVLYQREMESRGWTQETAQDYYDWSGKTTKTRTKWYNDAVTTVQNECYNEIVQIAKDNNSDFSMSQNLSKYGHTNKAEFFAETFANSQLSEPNELGTAMNTWLEQKGLVKK